MSQALYHHNQLKAPRELTPQGVAAKFRELNKIIADLQQQMAEGRGLTGSATVQKQRMDMSGQRLSNVGRTRHDGDVPAVRELRDEALYARNGIHSTGRLILARGGVRTVTPAVAPNDLISLGQAARLIEEATGVIVGPAGTAGTTMLTLGVSYPQVVVTLVNGDNHDVSVGGRIFVRIEGPTADFAITGLGYPVDGRAIWLFNATPYVMTLADENPGSTESWRISTLIGQDMTMTGPGVVTMLYDTAASRWIVA